MEAPKATPKKALAVTVPATPKGTGKRPASKAGPEETPAKVPRTVKEMKVGCWVTVKAGSRKAVDKNKATTPCLVTFLDGEVAKVLYPNMLSFFMHQHNGSCLIRVKTEECRADELRLCKKEDVAALDRNIAQLLAIAVGAREQARSSTGGDEPEPSKNKMQLLTTMVARAFSDAGREALSRADLEAALSGTFSAEEISAGLKDLDDKGKILLADEAVFLI